MALGIKSRLRDLVMPVVNRLGYNLVRGDAAPQQTLNLLQLASAGLIERSGGAPVAVQVGANDGLTDDPLRPILLLGNVKGVLVEPVPWTFEQLTANYAGAANVHCEQAAIGEADGWATLYVPDGIEGFSSRQASFDRMHLIRHGIPTNKIREEKVATLTFETLLAKHGLDRIDILQIDVEGYDYHILRMALAGPLRPRIIQFEHVHLSREDRAAARALLRTREYDFVEAASDTLAIDRHAARPA